jgi:hypothetical protein
LKKSLSISAFIFLILSSIPASAQISPGKLSRFHVALEGISNCTKCHELGKPATSTRCLECHISLKARIEAGKGYHSTPEVQKTSCFKCHSDHHGLEFDLVHWPNGQKDFNHKLTGYPLEGAHSRQECTACHRHPFNEQLARTDKSVNEIRTFLGLSANCTSCHEDEHRGSLDSSCVKCHIMDAWKPAPGFDHARARYALTGRHLQLECVKCHKLEAGTAAPTGFISKKKDAGRYLRFKPLEFASCTSCHQDVHQGRFKGDCTSCHSTNGWNELKEAAFDHSRTDYPLTGKHLTVACVKCHTSNKKTDKLKFAACTDCHRDTHKGQFAGRPDKGACESCHSVNGFKPARYDLEQHQKSRYPLTGGHLATPCESCHKQIEIDGANAARFAFTDLKCIACHADIHKGEADHWMTAQACESCHSTDGWRDVKFDHAKSKFQLDGKHKAVACDKCHRIDLSDGSGNRIRLTGLPMDCTGCHKDAHAGQFFAEDQNGECNRCHTAAGWSWLRFNHKDARYKLDGAHAKVACKLCHKPVVGIDGKTFVRYRPLGMTCADCHSGEVKKG